MTPVAERAAGSWTSVNETFPVGLVPGDEYSGGSEAPVAEDSAGSLMPAAVASAGGLAPVMETFDGCWVLGAENSV